MFKLGCDCTFLWVLGASAWESQKLALLQELGSFYGRALQHSDLEELQGFVREARALPVADFHVAYLLQGEEDTAEAEAAMWGNKSDVYVLTYHAQRPDALYFPGSIWAEGRNALLAAAAVIEVARARRYTYYILLDSDAQPTPSWSLGLEGFESQLSYWRPAVAIPDLCEKQLLGAWRSNSVSTHVFGFDHIFVAVHTDAAQVLLPYDAKLDERCWWTSNWKMQLMALALFRNHVLLISSLCITNGAHSSYSKNDCIGQMTNVSLTLRAAAPLAARDCFPDASEALHLGHGVLHPLHYWTWGRKQRKRDEMDYSRASLSEVSSCRDEAPVQALNLRTLGGTAPHWCPDCDAMSALFMLQGITARHLYLPWCWNELGIWLGRFDNFPLASACFIIAQRLMWLQAARRDTQIEENYARLLSRTEGWHLVEEEFWEDSGRGAHLAVQAALKLDGTMVDADLWLRPLLADGSLDAFVATLVQSNRKPAGSDSRLRKKILELLT